MMDNVLLEILRNRFQAIADEMAMVAYRTAHTVFVKETQDYATTLVSRRGEVFASPRRYGVLTMLAMPMDDTIKAIGDDFAEGDIFITNDPEATRGMATHLPDVFFWKPVFHAGRLVCWAWSFIHSSDVGGKVPGSISPSSYEIQHEGIRVPPRKLFMQGVLDDAFLKVFLANCRIPGQNWGDMKACVAALNTAEQRVHSLIEQYGVEVVDAGIDAMLNYAETQARRVISAVPDGVYTYVDYLEGDQLGLGMVRIKLDLHVRGDEFLLDYTGTDPQVRASLNMYTFSKNGHWNLIVGLIHWLCTMEPEIAYNAGMVRPFKVHVPSGTLLNPEFGVACGNRSATMVRMTDVNIGALAQAVPDQVPSFGNGQASILLVSVPDVRTGGTRVSVLQPLVGGSGARPHEDGVDGVDVIWSFLRNVPTESVESDIPPILVTHYGLRPDSGGAGRYRGGMGVEIEFETSAPYTVVTSRAMERYIFQPPGRLGGLPAATGYTRHNGEREIGKIDVLELRPGDRLRIGTQGGGGLGDALLRPVEAVLEDVVNGLVSTARAEVDYGIVFRADGSVDRAATEVARHERRAQQPAAPPAFTFGPARDAYHQQWPLALEDALAEAISSQAPVLRQFLHHELKRLLADRIQAGETVTPEMLPVLVDEIAGRLSAGYPAPKVG
jgi:N-methylhydantoinase B